MIIRLDPTTNQDQVIQQGKMVLLQGGLVACPTESFYGLAVDAGNEAAIRNLFSLKNRNRGRPVLILIPSTESLRDYVTHIPPVAVPLIRRFWPGGLTLIFEASKKISPLLTGGTGTIGIRLSSHPIPTALARAIQGPVTGTSANPSSASSCRRSEEVMAYFGERIDLIIDGGETGGGTGSTILDMTMDPPEMVRDGMIPRRALERCIRTMAVT
jgi:L-threonylcarbamoyladenylate synthase